MLTMPPFSWLAIMSMWVMLSMWRFLVWPYIIITIRKLNTDSWPHSMLLLMWWSLNEWSVFYSVLNQTVIVQTWSELFVCERMPSSGSANMQLPTSIVTRTRRSSSVWDYEQSLMFGQYREDLANFAQTEARKLKQLREDSSRKRLNQRKEVKRKEALTRVRRWPFWRWIKAFCQFGGDMVFFTTLAVTLAILSFLMDIIVHEFMHCKFLC